MELHKPMANCGLIEDPKLHFRDLALRTKELCQFGKINRLPLGLTVKSEAILSQLLSWNRMR